MNTSSIVAERRQASVSAEKAPKALRALARATISAAEAVKNFRRAAETLKGGKP